MKRSKYNVPPYELTGRILSLTASISERLGRFGVVLPESADLRLRRTNQIKQVQASLEIEGNSLSLEQVTAVSEGRRIMGAPKEVQEVRNALAAYDELNKWQPYSLDDLCDAHRILMLGLLDSPGKLRRGSTGIARGKDIVHIAPPADRVPHLLKELLLYLKESEDHPLVRGAVFHYELEFIHPFPDGNGRIGRLWQTLFLSRWNPLFSLMPLESIIRNRQDAYYRALRNSDNAGKSTVFVEFILEAIDEAISEAEKAGKTGSVKSSVKSSVKILSLIGGNPKITIPELATATGLSSRAVEKQIASLKLSGQLRRIGPDKGGYWKAVKGKF